MEFDYYLITKTQSKFRLRDRQYLIHFPKDSITPICNHTASYFMKLTSEQVDERHARMLICDDCLTAAGEH